MGGARLLALLAAATLCVALPPVSARAGSSDVAALQVAMGALGLYPHPVDGITGPWTTSAVERFQASRGLAVDGVAGPQTRTALGRRGRPSLGERPMRQGHRGWDVAALQFLLSGRGFGSGAFDGGFGPNTASAVRRFQAAAGLQADGVAGASTIAALSGPQVVAEPPNDPVRFLRPLGTPYTDGFGWVAGRRHTGLDFPAAMGTAVGAAGRGIVAFAGWNTGGYGNLVVVTHRLGFESWYAHLSSVSVGVGQSVAGGVPIGAVGSTGHSTGPHLHFEARLFGAPIDPVPRLLVGASLYSSEGRARASRKRLHCRPNADARRGRRADPAVARLGRCP